MFGRGKYLAIIIGPAGLGIYALLQGMFVFLTSFSGVWLSTGLMKYSAEFFSAKKYADVKYAFFFTMKMAIMISILMSLALLIFFQPVKTLLLSKEINFKYYLFFVLAFPFLSVSPILNSFLQGIRKIPALLKMRVLGAIVGLLFIIPLTSLFGLIGFFFSIFIGSVISLSFSLYPATTFFREHKEKLHQSDDDRFKNEIRNKLLNFGTVNFFLSCLTMGALFFQRWIVNKQLGVVELGLFFAAMRINNQMGMIDTAASTYFFPRISETLSIEQKMREIENYIYFLTPIIFLIASGVILFQGMVVRILFSSEFLPLVGVLMWFILPRFVALIGGTLNMAIVGIPDLRAHCIITLMQNIAFVIVPVFLINRVGILSLGLGLLLGAVCQTILAYFFLSKKFPIRFSVVLKRNYFIMLFLLIFTVYAVLRINIPVLVTVAIYILFVIITWFLLRSKEREKIIEIIGRRLSIARP